MSNSANTARTGRDAVVRELTTRGWSVKETQVGRRPVMDISRDGQRTQVRVSARRAGTWQTSTAYGEKHAAGETAGRFWIFVDLIPPKREYYVVPEDWMVENIYQHHQAYVARHGGERKINPTSKHHKIRPDRISEWRNRWDLLET
jgi:hypothetical protein